MNERIDAKEPTRIYPYNIILVSLVTLSSDLQPAGCFAKCGGLGERE